MIVLLFAWCCAMASAVLCKSGEAAYLRARGVIVVSERVLQDRSPPIGEYLGHPIWASVRFMGMDYRFSRVIDPRMGDAIRPRELLLAPGRVYVTD